MKISINLGYLLIKKKTNQTENCNQKVISASPGYVKSVRLFLLVQF